MSTPEAQASYRAFVQRYVKADQPSSDELNALEIERSRLKLLPDEAEAIAKEALKSRSASVNAPETQLSSRSNSANSHEQPQPKSADTAASQVVQNPDGVSTIINGATGKNALNLAASGNLLRPEDKNFATGTTIFPPQQPESYFAHLQQYGQEFLRALREEGFNLGEETRERLRKLAKQYELVGSDVADIERKMLVELYLNSKPPAQAATPIPSATSIPSVPVTVTPNVAEVEPKYDPQLLPVFEELEGSLKQGDLRAADIATFEILLKLLNLDEDWLDEESLRKFLPKSHDKRAVQEIDQLWRKYSKDHKLGFSSQLQLYGFDRVPSQPAALNKQPAENRRQASAFSKAVKWWINGLEFYKFYDQLDFSPDAPKGHLPALWFWRIPRQKVFQYGGLGLLAERGGCHIDSFLLPAFMCLLKNCDLNLSKKN